MGALPCKDDDCTYPRFILKQLILYKFQQVFHFLPLRHQYVEKFPYDSALMLGRFSILLLHLKQLKKVQRTGNKIFCFSVYLLTFITLLIYSIFPLVTLARKIVLNGNDNFKKDLVFVKGGCFKMGNTFKESDNNELPAHEVCVDNSYIGEAEVTQFSWRSVMGNNPSRFKGCDGCPVENVSWNDVQVFIKRINKITGKNYRLPTEADWEYAARSSGKRERWAGTNRESELKEYAWYQRNLSVKLSKIRIGS